MKNSERGQAEVGCLIAGIIVFVVLMVIMILVGGNFRTEVSFSPVVATNRSSEISFEENLTARHWIGGLVKGKQPDLQLVLGKYLKADNQVSHISIVTRHTFMNYLVTLVTLGIYSPMSVTIQGKISATDISNSR